MKVVQDQKSGEVWIDQPAYAKNIVQHFGMEHAKAVATPVDPSVKLEKERKTRKSLTKDVTNRQWEAYCTYRSEQDRISHTQ